MKISVSTNPPRRQDLLNYIQSTKDLDVDFVHCDVMDGKFVPSVTFDHKMLKPLSKASFLPLDVHLMVEKPWKVFKKYITSGTVILTVHFEAFQNKKQLSKTLLAIKKRGVFAGLAFNPSTPVKDVLPLVCYADVLLVMSVQPGKSGQMFDESTFDRLDEINAFLQEDGLDVFVEVDGGVNDTVAPTLATKNVQMVVLGNHLFSSKSRKDAVEAIKAL